MRNTFNICIPNNIFKISKEVPFYSKDGDFIKTKIVKTTFDLPNREYKRHTKDFLHEVEKSKLVIDHLNPQVKTVILESKSSTTPHIFFNEPTASANLTSSLKPVLQNIELYKDQFIHTNVNYEYLGKPKHLTPYLDLSHFIMKVESVLSSTLIDLFYNCRNHIEATTWLFVMLPGLSGECIAHISQVLELCSINYVGRPDVIQLENFFNRVSNKDLVRSFHALKKALCNDVEIKDETAFYKLKERLDEVKVYSYCIEESGKTLVFKSDSSNLLKQNRLL